MINTIKKSKLTNNLCWVLLAGGQRVQVELLDELYQDVLESRAEERESAEEGRSHKDVRVEGTVPSGAGGNTGTE